MYRAKALKTLTSFVTETVENDQDDMALLFTALATGPENLENPRKPPHSGNFFNCLAPPSRELDPKGNCGFTTSAAICARWRTHMCTMAASPPCAAVTRTGHERKLWVYNFCGHVCTLAYAYVSVCVRGLVVCRRSNEGHCKCMQLCGHRTTRRCGSRHLTRCTPHLSHTVLEELTPVWRATSVPHCLPGAHLFKSRTVKARGSRLRAYKACWSLGV
jgi:hypothetical protein